MKNFRYGSFKYVGGDIKSVKGFLMNKKFIFSAMLVSILALSFVFVSCDDGSTGGGGNGDPDLEGNISITSTGGVIGAQLTAIYTGTETVSYQWKRSGTNVGTNSNTYTPNQVGSYTVTVSAAGYKSKTSAAVIITSGGGGNGGVKLLRLTIPKALVNQADIIITGVNGKPLVVGAFKYGIFTVGTTPQQALAGAGYIAGNDGIWAEDASYTQSDSNHILTLGLYDNNGDDWNGTGTFDVYVVMGTSRYYRVPSVSISSATTSVTISAANKV